MEPPLIVIVGPTASGKSALAQQIAEQYSGEIICSDSRTIYKGMDIGTAKPSGADQVKIPHWGLDLIEPGERFSAADFKSYALEKIDEIRARGHVPIMVGGTGLYVDGILFDFSFKKSLSESLRKTYEAMTVEELQNYLVDHHIELPENKQNKRYLIRRIELGAENNQRNPEPLRNTVIVGITTDDGELRSRIRGRVDEMLSNGVIDEAVGLAHQYGWDSQAMTGNVYKLVYKFQQGLLDYSQLAERIFVSDWQLAKRQRTWFRRNPYIQWMSLTDAHTFLSRTLDDFFHP